MALWARLTGDLASSVSMAARVATPAVLGFLADLIPLAVSRACGVAGAGTSLDNPPPDPALPPFAASA